MPNTNNTQDKHTPGTLTMIKGGGISDNIVTLYGDNEQTIVAKVDGFDQFEKEANAARIVQCWNGWDDLQMKYADAVQDTGRLQAENEQLKKQVEVLREALDTVMARLGTFTESSAWEPEDQDGYAIGAEALEQTKPIEVSSGA